MELIKWNNDKIIIECTKNINEIGIQAIHLMGENLLKIKNKIIELIDDKRAPGFINYSEKEFGFKARTIQRYIEAFETQEINIKKYGDMKKLRR